MIYLQHLIFRKPTDRGVVYKGDCGYQQIRPSFLLNRTTLHVWRLTILNRKFYFEASEIDSN